jgi:uncharacterized membrane protein
MTAAPRLMDGLASKQRWRGYPLALFALVALAFIVRFHGIAIPVIWFDESFSLLLAERSPGQIWNITAGDVHPPLYYVMLHYWMWLFGSGAASVRTLSVTLDIGTLLLCMQLISLVASRRAACIAGLLFALLPISIRYSQEARMYTLIGFWLMAATVVLVCWGRQPHFKRYPLMYVLLMAAAFYTHYFAALCVLVHWLYWSGLGSGASVLLPARQWLTANVAIVVLYLPWVPNFVRQVSHSQGIEWIAPSTWQLLPEFFARSAVMISVTNQGAGWALGVSALILACAGLALRDRRRERRAMWLLIHYGFLPVIVLFTLSWVVPIFVSRYLLFCVVGLPMVVAIALDKLAEHRPLCAFLCLCLAVAGETYGLQRVYAQQDSLEGTFVRYVGRVDIVVEELKRQADRSDEVVVDGFFWYLPFSYYNDTAIQPRLYTTDPPVKGQGPWLFIPQERILSSDLSSVTFHSDRVWWVNNRLDLQSVPPFPEGWRWMRTIKAGRIGVHLFVREHRAESPQASSAVR